MTNEQDREAEEVHKLAGTLGRRGGLKGGKVRAEKLSDDRKSEIARNAAKARWDKWRRERQQEEESS